MKRQVTDSIASVLSATVDVSFPNPLLLEVQVGHHDDGTEGDRDSQRRTFRPKTRSERVDGPPTYDRDEEKRRAVVIRSSLSPLAAEYGRPLRCVSTTTPDTSSTTLSPPNASNARLPATTPQTTETMTSTAIHAKLKYSTLIPVLSLIGRQER
jgi:hypothetical protein